MAALLCILSLITTLIWQISAQSAPRFAHSHLTLKATPGKVVHMSCRPSGDPVPTITWHKDGTPIHELPPHHFSVNKESKALRIFNLHANDEGNYTCTAENNLGVDTVTIALLIRIQPETRIVSPSNLTFMEHTDQEIVCRARSHPRPFFEWLTSTNQRIRIDDSNVTNTTNRRLYSIEREVGENIYESVLYFRPMTYKDLGKLTCVAYNDIGHDRVGVSLDVHFSPKVLSKHSSREPVLWWQGHSVNLSCIVAGNDVPAITWSHNKRRFTCNKLEEWEEAGKITSSCIIKNREDGGPGVYGCRAKNSYGKTSVNEFHVIENFPPAAVKFVVVSVKRDEVVLAVTIPKRKDSPAATYVLATYKLAAGTGGEIDPEYERMCDVKDDGTGIVKLVGVRENSDYLVRVKARNSVGFGPETVSIINTAIPPAVTKTTSRTTVTRYVIGHASSDISSSTNDVDGIAEELTNHNDDEDEYEFERDLPKALSIRSSSSRVTIGSGNWFANTNIICLFTWIVLVFRVNCCAS